MFVLIGNCTIDLEWYSVQDNRVTGQKTWNHASFDLGRIARFEVIPELQRLTIRPPRHVYLDISASSHVNCTSFVKACCALCISAFEYHPKLRIGIPVSTRKDDRKGNVIRLVNCRVNRDMTVDDICHTFSQTIQRGRSMSVKHTLLKFVDELLNNDFIFNNWRDIETLSQRAPHLRLLSEGVSDIDLRKRGRQLYLSNDTTGWYIVKTRWYWPTNRR